MPRDQETRLIVRAKAQIVEQVPNFFPPIHSLTDIAKEHIDLAELSQTIKSEVARWVRQTIIEYLPNENRVHDAYMDRQHANSTTTIPNIMSFDVFLSIRRILEDIDDFYILADVLDLISDKVEGRLLIAISDTVNFYFDVFDAIGAAENLFRKLYGNVDFGRSQELEKAFLESLIDLGCRLPGVDHAIQRLRTEISTCGPKIPTAACSPISDTMIEAVQSTEPSFADEMDQMLTSGTSMDKHTLTRVFGTIVEHLGTPLDKSSHLVTQLSHLLATLRGFGPKIFDMLLKDWLQAWFQSSIAIDLSTSIVLMICSKVVSLNVVLQTILGCIDAESSQHRKTDLALDTLEVLINAHSQRMTISDYRSYRIFDELQITMRTNAATLVAIMHRAIDCLRDTRFSNGTKIQRHIKIEAVMELTQSILLLQANLKSAADSTWNTSSLDIDIEETVSSIIHISDSESIKKPNIHNHIVSILNNVSDFNILLFTLRIKTVLTSAFTSLQESMDDLSMVLIEQAIVAPKSYSSLWAYLISELSVSQAISIQNLAEGQVLSWFIDYTDSKLIEESDRIHTLMSVIEASAFCVPAAEASPLVERMSDILVKILPTAEHGHHQSEVQHQLDCQFLRIDVFLHLLIIHRSTIQHPNRSKNVYFHLLIALSFLLVNPLITLHPALTHRIFDVLFYLTDSISDDIRSRCIQSLRDYHHLCDSRLQFIFGYSDAIESVWLQNTVKATSNAEVRRGGTSITTKPYPLRKWEMMQDATPVATENDTSLSLTLFGSRKSVL